MKASLKITISISVLHIWLLVLLSYLFLDGSSIVQDRIPSTIGSISHLCIWSMYSLHSALLSISQADSHERYRLHFWPLRPLTQPMRDPRIAHQTHLIEEGSNKALSSVLVEGNWGTQVFWEQVSVLSDPAQWRRRVGAITRHWHAVLTAFNLTQNQLHHCFWKDEEQQK
jgi:hypothetical protein